MIPSGSGRELLDAAVGYALAGAAIATPAQLSRPTPCTSWDLQALLDHLTDSIGELTDLIGNAGAGAPAAPPGPWPEGDPVAGLRGQAARLRAACATAGAAARLVAIGDREITASIVAVTGAIEITVHGWDIFSACGTYRPVPPGLASALLPAAALLVIPNTRPGLFADPVRLPGSACPGDQLVAFLGRQPRSPAAA
jgi:uncharacterized protein (TIGR03086 family)